VSLSARPTIQRHLGDAFGWLCERALLALIGLAILRSRAIRRSCEADASPKSVGVAD